MSLVRTIKTGCVSLMASLALVGNAGAQLENPGLIPNPYATVNPGDEDWVNLPNGRTWGATSTVYSAGGGFIWAAERCGANGNCLDTPEIDPIFLIDPEGNVVRSFGDGHSANGNNRIVKYNSEGEYLMEWGGTGAEDGEIRVPHALAMDSQGRLFVADRGNSRLQIFDQDGKHLDTWTQFGRPSGLYIDSNDTLYSADSESNTGPRRNPGWYRGIRIGSAIDGFVTAFIPDPNSGAARGTSVAEGVTADEEGNVYGAEVAQRKLRKYSLQR